MAFLPEWREAVFDYYDTKLTEILSKIKDTLNEALAEVYNAAIQKLQESKDLQVQLYTAKLVKLVEELTNKLKAVDGDAEKPEEYPGLHVGNYTSIDFGEEAVCDYWAGYLQLNAKNVVEDVYQNIDEAIRSMSVITSLELPEVFENDSVFKQLVCYESFEDLCEKVTSLANKNSQNNAGKTFIEEIEDLVRISPELSKAMDALLPLNKEEELDEEENRRAIIISLINKLKDSQLSVVEKHQALRALKTELEASIKMNENMRHIVANLLCPSLLLIDETLKEDTFYSKLVTMLNACNNEIKEYYTSSNYTVADKNYRLDYWQTQVFGSAGNFDGPLADALAASETTELQKLLAGLNADGVSFSLLPDECFANADTDTTVGLNRLNSYFSRLNEIKPFKDPNTIDLYNITYNDLIDVTVSDTKLQELLNSLRTKLAELDSNTLSEDAKESYSLAMLEQQLLAEIRSLDVNNDFYYNVPVELSMAIEFNEDASEKNTLLNPITNYDINNVNNSFVISKLDIDYLDKGLQIARSSRLN